MELLRRQWGGRGCLSGLLLLHLKHDLTSFPSLLRNRCSRLTLLLHIDVHLVLCRWLRRPAILRLGLGIPLRNAHHLLAWAPAVANRGGRARWRGPLASRRRLSFLGPSLTLDLARGIRNRRRGALLRLVGSQVSSVHRLRGRLRLGKTAAVGPSRQTLVLGRLAGGLNWLDRASLPAGHGASLCSGAGLTLGPRRLVSSLPRHCRRPAAGSTSILSGPWSWARLSFGSFTISLMGFAA